MEKTLTCIGCPMGCQIRVDYDGETIQSIQGYHCKRGERYAGQEVLHPMRTLTSTVQIRHSFLHQLPVKTRSDIPKEKIPEAMQSLLGVTVEAPVQCGQTILSDIAGTGIDLVATRTMERCE